MRSPVGTNGDADRELKPQGLTHSDSQHVDVQVLFLFVFGFEVENKKLNLKESILVGSLPLTKLPAFEITGDSPGCHPSGGRQSPQWLRRRQRSLWERTSLRRFGEVLGSPQ